jgi:hypothetical protein
MNLLLSIIMITSLPSIPCPRYLPGTDVVIPDGIHLTHEQSVSNLMRCYCESVIPAELQCRRDYSKAVCKERTDQWIRENILSLMLRSRLPSPPNRGWRVISVEP